MLCSSRGEAAGWGRHCSKPPKETTRLEAQSSGWVAGAPGSCPGQDSGHQLVGLDSTWEQEGHGVTGQGLPSELGTPSGLDVPGALGNAALMSGWHWRHARTLVDKGRGIPLCRPAGFQNSCKQWPSVPSPEGSELAPPSPQPPGGPGALPAAVSRARTHKASPAVPGSVPSVTRSHRPRRHTAHLLHVPCLHAPPPQPALPSKICLKFPYNGTQPISLYSLMSFEKNPHLHPPLGSGYKLSLLPKVPGARATTPRLGPGAATGLRRQS